MNLGSEIVKNIFDDNAKGVIDTINQALLVKINDQIEEMKKNVIDSVYENDFSYMLVEKKKHKKEEEDEDEDEEEEDLDDKDLANNYGDKTKITRGDIISQAIHNKKKKGKKK